MLIFKRLAPLLLLLAFARLSFSQSDTSRINELNAVAWEQRFINLDSAMQMMRQSFALVNAMPKTTTFANHWKEKTYVRMYYYMSFFYSEIAKTNEAFYCLDTAMQITNAIDYDPGRSLVYIGRGLTYTNMGNYPQSLENFFKALKLDERLGNREGIAVEIANIGNIYAYQHDTKKALEYYYRALKLGEENKDKKRIALQLGNIGNIYLESGDPDKASEFYNKSLVINEEIGNKHGIAMNLGNLGSVMQLKKDYGKASDYYLKAIKISQGQGNLDNVATFIGNLGAMYMLSKDYKKSEEYLLKALSIFKELQALEAQEEFELALSDLYAAWGKDKLALEHYKIYTAAKDSIFNALNTEKSVRAEMNYEFDKKAARHEKEIIELEAKGKIQKQLHWFLLIFIGLILILLFFVKRAYDNKKRMAGFMESEAQRKEVLLQEVHHRINNNLQVISSLLSLQASSVQDERLNDFLKQSQNRIQSLSVMHELLYQTDSMLEINMREYLDKVLSFHRDVLSTKSNNVMLNINIAEVNFPTKTAVPIALIVNELITNSIKYAFDAVEHGKIEVSLLPENEKNNTWILRVSDNGKGLPEETGMRKNSLGLRLVNIMVKQLSAGFTKNNTPGASFTVEFSLTS